VRRAPGARAARSLPFPPMQPMRIALSVAGSDPTGGAGLQLDLQVFRALGVHGAGVPTALTVQNTAAVLQVLPVFPSVVQGQLRALLGDLRPHAVKLGMLASDDVLRAVAQCLGELAEPAPPLVLDPLLFASDGTPLLERRAWDGLRQLCARAALLLPNLAEAEALCGRDVSSRAGVEAAARACVLELGAAAALVKGGHAESAPDDCLAQRADGADGAGGGVQIAWLTGERLARGPVHGTGCALAAACAAHLARGAAMFDAVQRARDFVRGAIAESQQAGKGARLLVFGANPAQ